VELRQHIIKFGFLLLFNQAASAQTCDYTGQFEKLIEPAKTEDGFIRLSTCAFELNNEVKLHKAKYAVMTEQDYRSLEENMTYETYVWHEMKIFKTEVYVHTDIADYDIVYKVDGGSFQRPASKPVNIRTLYNYDVESPRRREVIVKVEKRPEPEKLVNGMLKVMMSPAHKEALLPKGGCRENWRHYIEYRSPATYQQVKCNEDEK